MRYSGTRVSGGLALRPHFASRSWNALRTAPSWNVELSKLVESIVVGLDGGVRRLEIERHTHNWGRHSLQRKLPWRRGGCSACKQAQVGDVRIDCHSESPSGVRNLLFDYNSRFLGPKGPRNDKELSVRFGTP